MSSADEWFFDIAFGVLTVLLFDIRAHVKRIEKKIDKLMSK
jgi:hypothetical protein